MSEGFAEVVAAVKACDLCKANLPLGPRPVFQIHPDAKILVAAQAPGLAVHETGIPFNDPSGERLRSWMGITRDTFYDAHKIALLPMGFCYPGTGKSGDLPPRLECAPQWRTQMLALMPNIRLTLIIGQYAHKWHLGNMQKITLTETVRNWRDYMPSHVVLPHPSPRNNIWLKRNSWFEIDVLPVLKTRVRETLMS